MNSDVCKQDHSSTSSRYARWPQLRRVLPASLRPFLCSRRLARIERAPASARSLELAFSSSLCATGLHPTIPLPFARSPLCLASSPPSPRNDDASRHRNDTNDTNDRTRLQTTTHDYSRLRYDTKTTSIRYKTAGDDQQWRFPSSLAHASITVAQASQ